ncbi:MAG: DUF4824 family protein [Bryobacteraceae bacterium]
MKHASLITAGVVILIANGSALVHALRNRTGPPDAEITLSQRELMLFGYSAHDEDSGVSLRFSWTDPDVYSWVGNADRSASWLDRTKLAQLGFDCRIDPAKPDAARHYQRQRPRQAFVALEYDGAAWKAWQAANDRAMAEQKAKMPSALWPAGATDSRSRLIPVDADLDPVRLRARRPDRVAVIVLPAIVGIYLQPAYSATPPPDRPARLTGRILELPASIHVPRPFSAGFRRPLRGAQDAQTHYRVHVRYGAFHEPWITAVDFQP